MNQCTILIALPYESHVKICKGQPRRFALWKLIPNWCKTFPPDHIDLAEMKKPTWLRNKTSTAYSCVYSWRIQSSEQDVKYLY